MTTVPDKVLIQAAINSLVARPEDLAKGTGHALIRMRRRLQAAQEILKNFGYFHDDDWLDETARQMNIQ
jgi:hypothetical protein